MYLIICIRRGYIMKVISYLNDVPFDELSYEEKLEFSTEVQIRMLKMAGYTPIEVEDESDKID